jgi:plasmid stabilization system protein ParE
MGKEIRWTDRAIKDFESVLNYLNSNWSDKEVINFISKAEKLTTIIVENPFLFRKTGTKNFRESLITKHNLLVYKVTKKQVFVVTVWDTRMHPVKKKFKK